ncbi:hypothetical protein BDV23DRAFT_11565 [Aspergillus alliaceus]|uniref:Carrier domain-containing protein n=1 Tax=Petromyces alliaceus TaxID=209559 RepID=A0A5N7CKG4_PETAA|nr:hypothetical protein BDV23DRAFT_11565 [Aspergillus alliaceus]
MAHSTQCFLPKFSPLSEGPKRPMSMKTRTSRSETTQLISAWHQGQLAALLQTTWALVLYRYTGSGDICFGFQHASVTQSSNTSTLCTYGVTLSENDSIRELLERVRSHNDLANSAEKCGTWSATQEGFRLYNTMMMIRNCRDVTRTSKDIPVQPVAGVITLPNECRIRLHVKILNEDVGMFMEWWNNDMSTEQMKCMSSYFQQVLTRVLAADDVAVSKLGGILDSDLSRVYKFNAVTLESHDRCIHEVIHEQALLRPEREAVCAWDGSLTYSQLDLLASQLAYHLQAQGVGPEVRVALCFDKSKWNTVALLAVLKAGGAFVPLDPAHPVPRLKSLAQSVQASIMLCSRNHAESLSAVVENLIPLDSDTWDELSIPHGEVHLSIEVKSCNAAYVIFTSGSTGEPKGTLMEHKAYVSSAMAHAPQLRVFSDSRVLQFAAHTFDASLVEILTALLVGACICVPSEEERLNSITKVINEMRVNHATLTPSFVDFINISDIPRLETLVLAGEAMSQSQLDTWSNINLVNGFGPTETAVTAAVNSKVTKSSDCRDIGLPTGVHCWIVDSEDHNQLVPVGCVGEMIVEGPSLARGYVNNQQKTAEVFIYDPAWAKDKDGGSPGRRFYKTGDLVRYNSDAGSLTYLGRKDTQVKFHGQRIELGEIEDNLNTDTKIKHCLVFLPKSGFSEGRLAAVLSLSIFDDSSDSEPKPLRLLEDSKKNEAISQIRDRLSARLPAYMIPTVWLCVETLPFLVSGKLDRKATANWVGKLGEDPNIQLAKPDSISNEVNIRSENATEEQLALIWSRVLNVPRSHISLDESFLSLGGDSIAGLTCVGYCKKQGIGITVQDVLRSKSIRDLATRAKEIQQLASYEEVIEKPFDLSPIQKLHFMVRKEGQGHFNQSVLTRLNKHVDNHDLRRSVETLVSQHSMLRSRLTALGAGELQQRITEDVPGSYRWGMHDVCGQQEIEHVIADSQSCINAFTGPVLAVDIFDVNGKDRVLSLIAHHLVVDIVSWRIILEDLEDLLSNPHEASSQSGSLPFQTWCQLQTAQCQKPDTGRGLETLPAPDFAYWGMEKRPTTYGDVDCETFEVDVESTHTLLMDCHQSLQTEPIDVFLASLLHSFQQTFNDRSLPVIYNEGHGREVWDSAIDISRTVGWFTILHPIALQRIAEDDPVKTVVRVKDLRRRVTDNGRQEFARRLVGDGKDRGHHCPMEISFNYVGQHRDLQRQDGVFQLMNQMAGETGQGGGAADFGEDTPRFALFEISAMVAQGRLRFTFSFNRYMEHQQPIRDWISSCHNLLKHLGPTLRSLAPKPTLSSFPMLSLTYEELETILLDKLPSVGIDSPDKVEDIYPCSRMQQGILLSRSRDESLYSVHDTFEVKGLGSEPDLNRLVLAWQEVVMHHAMLRTIFVDKLTSRELFCQVVLKTFDSQPKIMRGMSESDVLATFDEQGPMTYFAHRPPHRFTICQTTTGKIFCRLEINHASMDGSSISIIVRDLQLAYGGKLETHHGPMFRNVLQYLREQDDSTEYWSSYLSNSRPCLFPLLNDGSPSNKQLRSIRLNVSFYSELLGACEKGAVTLSTAISTAWGLTLRQFCGSNDVCFSYLASLRDMPVEDIESIVGPVITLLACRMRIPESSLIKDLLCQVQNDYMEQLSHRNTSLIDIQHALKLSDTTLFNTGVSYRKLLPSTASNNEEVQFVEVGSIYDPAEFPLYVNVEVADDDAHIDLNYWTTALSDCQADNVASVFLKALENIVYCQDNKVISIDGLSDQNKKQIAAWNSQAHKAIDKSVREMFDEKVESRPDAPAITAWDGELTYAKLDELSSILANYLTKLGVGSGALVPLDIGKSMWQAVSVLAVLKAGGIGVPMGGTESQTSFLNRLVDDGAQVALASPDRAQLLEATMPYVVPMSWSLFECLSNEPVSVPVQPSDDCYVIFTEGSSSNPKALVLNHNAILARAEAFISALNMTPETRVFQLSPYTSDMFVQELFGSFMCGGCVCIPSENEKAKFSTSINTLRANLVNVTPTVASFIRPADVPGVQCLSLFGERLTEKVKSIWLSKVKLHTFYGTAEYSSTCVHNADDRTSEPEKIGLGNGCVTWLVDPSDYNVLVPVGCTGELVLEGPGIAQRYFNDEKQKNQSFIENPEWSTEFGKRAAGDEEELSRRMLRTGDLARYNSDGTLVYMGRKDGVIERGMQEDIRKIEQRIDLALLTDNRSVVEVIDCCNEQGTTGCLAVFILFEDRYVTETEASRHVIAHSSPEFHALATRVFKTLLRSLPATQVPSFYFPVHDIPLRSSGRLDRQALRDAAQGLSESTRLEFTVKKIKGPYYTNANTEYWKEYLADAEPCLFPSLFHTAVEREHGVVHLKVNDEAKVQKVCQTAEVTMNSLLHIIWGLVLRCYTGLEDVCFGYRTSDTPEMLPCRINLKDDIELERVVQKRNEELNQGAKHSITLSEIQLGLGLQDTSIFNTAFVSEYSTATDLIDGLFTLNAYMIVVDTKEFDSLEKISFYYSRECLSDANISDIVDCFEHILNSVLYNTSRGKTVGDIDFFSEQSCKKIGEWNTKLPETPEKCAHEVIRQQVLCLPLSTPAICSWDTNLTYSEVEHLTTRLAHYLVGVGVGPENFVALFFEKSAWYVIAQVAVLKAGGAFVSLDPSHPEARLRGLVGDVGAHVMLCSAKHYEKASRLCNIAFVVCEATIDGLTGPATVIPAATLKVNNAAYAIFTSGTTGKPKVSVIEHIGLGIAAKTFTKTFRMGPKTRVLQFSNYIFDVNVMETVITLMTGGCICIPSEEERMNDLSGAISRMAANLCCLTPSAASTLNPDSVPTLKTIIMGGEKMTISHVDRWADRCVINAYGPSEATVASTASVKADGGRRLTDDCNSIGTAFAGRTWIVDPQNYHRLLPIGAVGELILESCNVARGYLNNAEKTKEVFITDPQWIEHKGLQEIFKHKERMYRTGDLVRYNSDGSLCFVSRKDTQIKLNGQRVELGEIEQQCIGYLPTNTQVAVEVVSPQARTVAKCLAVFFTIDVNSHSEENGLDLLLSMDEATVDMVEKLHSSLKETLPTVMIPKLFFPISRLPFAATGKLDRKGLRAMVEPLPKEELKQYTTFSAGSRQISEEEPEGKLRTLWEEALGLAPGSVNTEDSFFGIGGDSLSAMKLVGAAHSHGIALTVADIYANPILIEMAKICEPSKTETNKMTVEPFSLLPASLTREDALQEAADQCCVSKGSVSDIYPCSPVQEGLITLSMKQQGAYVARPIFKLTSKVDLKRFKAAWQKTVDEFDILRTRIIHTDSMGFVQVVLSEGPISWTTATTIDDIMDDIPELPNHNGGLLTDYSIVQSENSSIRYFIWTVHHALYDGWSVPLVLKRVEELYKDSSANCSTLPYKLFISHLQDKDLSHSDKFWKTQLADISCSPFPQSKASLPDAVRVGNRHYSSMEISRIPESKYLTLPELIRAAWAIVISVHTGSNDVCFGETLMGRNINLRGITDVAGPVLTTVPTRIQVDNELLVSQFLQDIRKLTTAMIPHQHSGLQRIRKLSDNTAVACDFQNLLVIQTEEGNMNEDLWVPENNQTSGDFFTHPLTVECKISNLRLVLTVHHDEIVLDSWQTERLTNQFIHVIQQLLTFSEKDTRKVGDLEVASPQDKQEIYSWNQRHPTLVDRCVHDIIREKGSMQPEAPAICAWDGQLSYREMYGYASSFAAYLNSRGVGPETLVPVCLDKSVWAIVTILGVLIAGGAFVPLDPAHPTSRHEEILEEIEARVILCSSQYRNRYAGSVKTIVPISQETIRAYSALTRKASTSNLATPSNMAYAIFTSGSTGRPKGIIIEHRALASSAAAFSPIVHLNENARAFQFASLTFDAAVMEVLATLMHGGCICIPSEEERLNDVAGAIRRMDVSWAFLTPSIASIIDPLTVPSLKVLACGGEKLSREVVLKWAHRVKLINGYGPTETTIFAVLNDVTPSTNPAYIGYGIPSTLTWVVDPENHNRLSPLGAIGELALEGAALAREYLKSPAKTAEAFVNEPTWINDFPSSLPSPRRIYKTGDLVRYNSDGSIEYISRKDNQVKINGLRMELGEIEHRLCGDRRVRHAVVILPKLGLIQKRLVAILSLESLNSGNGLDSNGVCELISQDQMDVAYSELQEIQKSLESQLPIYMVPQTWAVIGKLPMLVSGKLDRKKITAWIENINEETYDRIMQDYDNIKRGNTDHKNEDDNGSSINILRDIFTQVLNVPSSKIDPSRSFVSLGGDSITGMAVISRARKHGLNLTLHNILQSNSMTELALTSVATVQEVQHQEKSGELFNLSPIQGLYIQTADQFQGRARFNQSMTVRLTRRTRSDVVKNAVKGVVDRHSMFRARFCKSPDGNWKQKITKDINSSYQFRTHSINDSSDMLSKISESQECLDIQNGPIFAADLFEVRSHEQFLFIVANHFCVDMVSWRIVLQDLQDFIENGALPSDKPLSFQGWCDLQAENSKRKNGIIELPFSIEQPNIAYWGMADSPNLYGHVKIESFTLTEEATAFILGRCHEALQTETVEVLLSSIIHSFRQVFVDRKVPTIYNEGHGRETWDSTIDLSRTVGWFTTLCPLHVDEGSGIVNTLKRVKDTRRKIANNSRSYFAQSLLHPTGDGPTNFPVPLEVVFNYLGQLQQLERKESLFQHYGGAFDAEFFELAGDMGPETPRFALFEISAIIIKDKLNISFTYNRNMRHKSRIQDWIFKCRRTLEGEILSLKDYLPEPTLSDYPLLPTTYGGLDDLVKKTLPRIGVESWNKVEDIYPCSPVQEGILLSQLRDPRGYMFHGIFEVRSLQGKRIDPASLRRAWTMVVNRHPALRTLFIESNYKGGAFDQLVLKVSDDAVLEFECDESLAFVKLDQVKLQDINANRRTKLPQQLIICTTTSGRVFMKIEMNHAIVDGGSIDVLFRDLALAYNNQLPAGPGPRYSDYIKYIRSQAHGKALEHWKQYLSGVRPCHLSFPANQRGDRQLGSHLMSFDRFSELQRFCEDNSITLANLTLTTWAVVLRSFTGSDDICFGYPSAGRDSPIPGIHDAVGIFINMVCCRIKFTSGQTLEGISKLVQSDYIGNLPHQNCSLAQIQHDLGHQGQSLFNTTLSIQNRSVPKDSGDKTISFDMQRTYDPTEYPVTVNVETTKDREGIMLRYWTDMVSDSQAEALADAIAKVFTCFIESPSRLVSELKLAPSQDTSAISNPALTDLDILNSDALRKVIDIRVNETISQMLKEGKLALPTVHELHIKASNGSFPSRRMPREKDLSDSTLTLTDRSRASSDSRESTSLEKRLWTLWSSALGLSSSAIIRKSSFFKLGGDSITAMKMVGAAREEGLALSVADVFSNPVFEDMLAIVTAKDVPAVLESHAQVTQVTQLSEKVIESPVVITRAVTPDEMSLLRPTPIDDSSLQASICSRIGVFRGGIADVLPVTDFQAMSITASLFKSRWMLNYFFLDGKGPLDIRRLRESFLRVVDAFDILRTVFVCFHGQFFQVVLRKMKPEITVHETDKSLDDYTESLQQHDREQDPRQGEQYVQFYVVKKKSTNHHRILIRMSHTQFDGVCLPRIMSAIKMGYEGSPIPPTSSFSNYMRMLPGSISPEHYQHWATLLQGSQMTDIIRRQTPNNFQHIGSFTAQKKAIEISATVIGDVTLATVMQSAWAMTLAKLSAQSDVVFGLTISGRNATIPGIESTVGPCLNMIPVRVKFGERWTGLDLFRYLQDQQVSNMPYESLGFREIIRNCTDWPDSTFFTTSVFHQSVEYEGHMQLDDNMYRMGGVGVVDNFTDITVVSKPTGDGRLYITLAYSQRSAIDTDFAAKILDMLCETAHSLITNPRIALPSPSTLRSLPCQVVDDLPRPTEEHFLNSNLNSRSISELLVHSDILNKAWQQVLPSRDPDTPRPPFQLNSSFFGLGGDIFSMGQLAWCLEQEGLQVRLEELLEHPTFLGHLAVLALHNAKQETVVEGTRTIGEGARVPSVKNRSKTGNWNPLGKAVLLARRFTTKWSSKA